MPFFLIALLAFALPASAGTPPVAATGQAAPHAVVTDINGVRHSIGQPPEGAIMPADIMHYPGKIMVLEWHNPGCPFVKKFYQPGAMQALQQEAASADIVWITVNSSAPGKQGHYADDAAAKAAFADAGLQAATYIRDEDGTLGQLYGAKTTPHMYVIDKKGILAYQGAIDSIASVDSADISKATPYLKNALAALQAGKAVAPSATTAYGCSVKYAD